MVSIFFKVMCLEIVCEKYWSTYTIQRENSGVFEYTTIATNTGTVRQIVIDISFQSRFVSKPKNDLWSLDILLRSRWRCVLTHNRNRMHTHKSWHITIFQWGKNRKKCETNEFYWMRHIDVDAKKRTHKNSFSIFSTAAHHLVAVPVSVCSHHISIELGIFWAPTLNQ